MRRTFLRAKIHQATVTEACLEYVGSLTLDRDLMDAAALAEYERIEVYNITSGHRFATYVIEGRRGSGEICVNGAAAHLVKPGDLVIIASWVQVPEERVPGFDARRVFVDSRNRIRP